jgi:hypothetical protein
VIRVSLPVDILVNRPSQTVGKAPPDKEIGDFGGGKPCNCAGFRGADPAENVEFQQYHRVSASQIPIFFQKKICEINESLIPRTFARFLLRKYLKIQ